MVLASSQGRCPGCQVIERPLLQTVSSAKVRKVKWLDPGRIPLGALTILDGDPGTGKSTITLDYAARVSRGFEMPGGDYGDLYNQPSHVIIMSAEDDISTTIRPKLEAMDADIDLVHILKGVERTIEDSDDDEDKPLVVGITIKHLEMITKAMVDKDARLLIIDPLMAYLPSNVNAHKDQDIRAALGPLILLARQHHFAILVVRHLNKLSANPQPVAALYRGGGSIGIAGASRSTLVVGPDLNDDTHERRVLSRVKGNLCKPPPSLAYRLVADGEGPAIVSWEGETTQDADETVRPPAPDMDPTQVQEAKEWLVTKLRDGVQPTALLLKEGKQLGFKEHTLRRAKRYLGALTGKGAQGEWTWFLPDDGKTPEQRLQQPTRGRPRKGGKRIKMPCFWQNGL